MKTKLYTLVLLILLCFMAVFAFALWPTKIHSISSDNMNFNDITLIERGKYLATVGDCTSCHTAPTGEAFAGGLPLASPIGNVYSSNITPDKKTGIGNYTLMQFDSALRYGIRSDGATLYPAMPYPSFSFATDDDITALYAYFMHGVPAISQDNLKNDITWPLSIRWPVAIWRKVYAPQVGTSQTARRSSNEQNDAILRGAYLVQGLGHCGACHTPRAFTMQEKALTQDDDSYLAGGEIIDGWYATSLRNNVNGLSLWSEADIIATLKTGRNEKFVVLGPGMTDVVRFSTQHMAESDLAAIAAYLKSLPSDSLPHISYTPEVISNAAELSAKNLDSYFLYKKNCSACHGEQGEGVAHIFPALAGNSSVLSSNPTSLIRIVLDGYDVPPFNPDLISMQMPKFEGKLKDDEVAAVITYIRSSWGNQAPAVMKNDVQKMRASHE